MENKLELIRCFDVDRFINWHSKLYEEIPLDLLEAEKRANQEIYSEWASLESNIQNGTKKKSPKRKKQLTDQQKSTLEEYRDRQKWADFLSKGSLALLDVSEFNVLKLIVENHANEVRDIEKLIDNQFIKIDYVLSSKLDEYVGKIDLDIIDLALKGQYIFKARFMEAAQTLCDVKVCQWLMDQLDRNAKIKDKRPMNAAQKVAILYAAGVIDYLDSFGASVPETEKALLISTLIEANESNIRSYLSDVRSAGQKCSPPMTKNKKDAVEWIKENAPVFSKQRQDKEK